MKNSAYIPIDLTEGDYPGSTDFFQEGQIININKPTDWTSFDVVKKIRGRIKVKKVGHAGTLDPFATGVLLICTGKATKQVSKLMGLEKEYQAVITLGKVTDTYDRTGKVMRVANVSNIRTQHILDVCQQFLGEIMQTPPMYSALKVNGQRLYKLARRGIEVQREARRVTLSEIELLSVALPNFTIRVLCSKGTYIRSLAYDIGEKLGCGGYLAELTRTRIGAYSLGDSQTVQAFLSKVRGLPEKK